jgi:hypothetical protein
MFVPLPELDDRRFQDLVDEGRSLIPTYAPSWTDHNAHDPGITVMEVLAWIAETAMYSVDRIPEGHRRAFLSLVGVEPEAARPAQAIVQFALSSGASARHVAAGTELAATLLDGKPGVFRTVGELDVLPTRLVALQVQSRGRYAALSNGSGRGTPVAILGDDPVSGDALYLGFDAAIGAGSTLRLELELAGDRSGAAERQRIEDDLLEGLAACSPRLAGATGPSAHELAQHDATRRYLALSAARHHSAVLTWEAWVEPGVWAPLAVVDETRAASLSGSIGLTFAESTRAERLGVLQQRLHFVRARLAAGVLDRAPVARSLRANAARVEQLARAVEVWPIAKGVVACGEPPPPGAVARVSLDFEGSEIVALDFDDAGPDALRVRVLDFSSASNQAPGRLLVEAVRLGVGSGAPHQRYRVPGAHVVPDGFELYSLEGGAVLSWQRHAALRDRGPADRAFVLDLAASEVVFGDGQNGRVPPSDAILIAIARHTAGALGNVPADAIVALPAPRGRSTWPKQAVSGWAQELTLTNAAAASGGAPPESLTRAEGRAFESVQRPERAVTLDDCERLALETPGTGIARAAARANCVPGLDCITALGFITVVVVPFLPKARPMPSQGLLAAVSRHLERRRILGTRVVVAAPEYLEVAVNAQVRAVKGQNKAVVQAAVDAALRGFFDPLGGGPERTGWPLGRDVFISEVLDTIARVPGVDHVISVEIAVPGCGPQCGDVCLRPLALVVSGSHRIVVS